MKEKLTDDEKYVLLMESYKRNRHAMGQKANKILDAAMELKAKGNVSKDAILGGQYI
jgi:hypothetical protein